MGYDWEGAAYDAGFSNVEDYLEQLIFEAEGREIQDLNSKDVEIAVKIGMRQLVGIKKTVYSKKKNSYFDLIEMKLGDVGENVQHNFMMVPDIYVGALMNIIF